MAFVSFAAGAALTAYNLIVGIVFRLTWHFCVSFYYMFFMLTKAILLGGEFRWKNLPLELRQAKRIVLFKIENVFLLLIDLSLIVPVLLLISQGKREADLGMTPTIALAASTTYRIVMACVQYSQSKRVDHLVLYGLKIISLKEAIVSVMTLQNTMVVAFGDVSEMATLTTWTNVGMYLSMVAISVVQIVKARKVTAV